MNQKKFTLKMLPIGVMRSRRNKRAYLEHI